MLVIAYIVIDVAIYMFLIYLFEVSVIGIKLAFLLNDHGDVINYPLI